MIIKKEFLKLKEGIFKKIEDLELSEYDKQFTTWMKSFTIWSYSI